MSDRGKILYSLCRLSLYTAFILFSFASLAGGRDLVFFSPRGKMLDLSEVQADSVVLPTRFNKSCSDSDQLCFDWKIYVPAGTDSSLIQSRAQAAMNVWENYSNFRFTYQGLQDSLPDHDSAERDGNDNIIFENSLLISTEPPSAWRDDLVNSNDYARVFRYLIPNFSEAYAEISGVAIYLNPRFLPTPYGNCTGSGCVDLNGNGSLSLKSILISYIGIYFIGLDASGVRDSLMFPVQGAFDGRTFNSLSRDEEIWLAEIYSPDASQTMGMIRGQLRNGLTGETLQGGYVTVVDSAIINLIAESKRFSFRDHIVTGALVGEDGRFEIPVPPGRYALMVEALDGSALRPEYFNDWAKLRASNATFPLDFYDGAGRESNKETWEASAPSLILAAQLDVRAGELTEVAEFYTNEPSSPNSFSAVGSSNETLSTYTLEDLASLLDESNSRDLQQVQSKGGGCQLSFHERVAEKSKVPFLVLILSSFLTTLALARARRGRSSRKQSDQRAK